MDITTSTWTGLHFFPIFTPPGAEIFSQLIIGWVLCTARRTVTGMLPFADPLGLRAHGYTNVEEYINGLVATKK